MTKLAAVLGVFLVMACAACGSGGDAQTFTAACEAVAGDASYFEATHDFGTTDPATLARVVALVTIPDGYNYPGGQVVGPEQSEVPVHFFGSVAHAGCSSSSESVVFVLAE